MEHHIELNINNNYNYNINLIFFYDIIKNMHILSIFFMLTHHFSIH
jgi:hypothetical protein